MLSAYETEQIYGRLADKGLWNHISITQKNDLECVWTHLGMFKRPDSDENYNVLLIKPQYPKIPILI